MASGAAAGGSLGITVPSGRTETVLTRRGSGNPLLEGCGVTITGGTAGEPAGAAAGTTACEGGTAGAAASGFCALGTDGMGEAAAVTSRGIGLCAAKSTGCSSRVTILLAVTRSACPLSRMVLEALVVSELVGLGGWTLVGPVAARMVGASPPNLAPPL